jgi:Tfp pilus assembly protein PilN
MQFANRNRSNLNDLKTSKAADKATRGNIRQRNRTIEPPQTPQMQTSQDTLQITEESTLEAFRDFVYFPAFSHFRWP